MLPLQTFEFSSDNSQTTGLFSAAYAVVSRANFVLSYLITEYYLVLKDNIEAEARAIRAAAHFDILRAYSVIPTQNSPAKINTEFIIQNLIILK
jgi:hypothetical protein